MKPIEHEIIIDRRRPAVRWGAMFAGTAVAIGIWIFLQLLGTGVGLASVDAANVGSLQNAGVGTGIWSLIAPAVALFVGGLVVARVSNTSDRVTNGIHAAVTWSVTTIVGTVAMV